MKLIMTNKKIIIVVIMIVSTLLFGFTYIENQNIKLGFSTDILEYGEDIDFNTLIECKGIKVIPKNYDNRKIGKQEVVFEVWKNKKRYNDATYIFEIKDTKFPEIKLKQEKVEIEYKDNFIPDNYIESVKDQIDGNLKYELEGSVDSSKSGNYIIKIVAVDKNNNKSEKQMKVTVKEPTKTTNINQQITNKAIIKQHYINSSAIVGYNLTSKYGEIFIDTLYSGNNKLYFEDGDREIARKSWVEILDYINIYLDTNNLPDIGESTEENYFELFNFEAVHPAIVRFVNEREAYQNYITNTLYSINLNTDDYTLVNNINTYIKNNYSYKITNSSLYTAVSSGAGQCWHYASIFRDLCSAVGISAGYVTGWANGTHHAWNYVIVDGYTYWFDVTWNDAIGIDNYSWLTESQIRRDHSW